MAETHVGTNKPAWGDLGVDDTADFHVAYTAVPGFFQQDDPLTDANTFSYADSNLGLINRSYPTDELFDPSGEKTQWERFQYYVESLDSTSSKDVQYKVLYMGRHGQGYHNVAESHYGTELWDSYWSKLDGDGTIVWADAHLTEIGISQARVANSFWRTHLASAGIPAPQSYYTSPLARCLATASLTFADLDLPSSQPFVPIIKELLREVLGVHTCDRRSSKSWIRENHPSYKFEEGFAEDDPLWLVDVRESDSALVGRLKKLLDDVFAHDSNTWISFSSHSGAIGGILQAISHRPFGLPTGAVIPALVKAERTWGAAPNSMIEAWGTTRMSSINVSTGAVSGPASATEPTPAPVS